MHIERACPILAVLAAGLLSSSIAHAQTTYDPQIAYTQVSGKSQQLYLANADGSHAVKVATVGINVAGIDFAPGGGRVAFSDNQGIKVLSYTASNAGIAVTGTQMIVPGRHGGLDFSPDGTRLLYYSFSPDGVRVVPSTGGTPVLVYAATGESPRWLRDELGDAFAFYRGFGTPVPRYEIWTVLINDDGTVTAGPVVSTTSQSFKNIESVFDVAHTRNALLLSVGYPIGSPFGNRLIDFDLETGAVTDRGVSGFWAHYAANDASVVFRNLPTKGAADHVYSLDVGSGVLKTLTAKRGEYHATDARP